MSVELKETSGPNEKKPADNPAIKNMYLVTVNERGCLRRSSAGAFDTARAPAALTAAAISNLGAIRASADEAAAAADRLERGRR